MTDDPTITLKKDGSFYRVVLDPPETAIPWFHRPMTYTAHALAADTAALLAKMTGWSLVDRTKAG